MQFLSTLVTGPTTSGWSPTARLAAAGCIAATQVSACSRAARNYPRGHLLACCCYRLRTAQRLACLVPTGHAFLLAHALHMLHKHFDCNTELKTLNQPAAMAYVEAAASLITVAYGQKSNWGMLHEIGHNHQINEMTPPSTGEVGGKGCSKGRRVQQREGEMWEAREGRKHERNTVQLCVAHGPWQQHGPSFSASNNLARLVSNASEWNAVQLDSNETHSQTPQVTCNFWSLYGMEKVERVDRTTRYTNRRAETLAYWADTTCRYPACFSPEVGIYM